MISFVTISFFEIWDHINLIIYDHINFYVISAYVGCWPLVFIYLQIFNVCPFHYTDFAVSVKVEMPLTGFTTQLGVYRYPNWPS